MKITLPEEWSTKDISQFMDFLEKNTDSTPERRELAHPSKNCWNCRFWHQDGEKYYRGHCGLYSCECTTRVGNHLNPSRWMEKEEN